MTRAEFLHGAIQYLPEGLKHELAPDEWLMRVDEEPRIRASVKEICERYPITSVLEVGFGYGFTATKFQEMGVARHVIVEPHPTLFADAQTWAKQYKGKHIEIVQEFIQDYQSGEHFDLIYDDRYELVDKYNTLNLEWRKYDFDFYAPCYTFPENMEGSDQSHGFLFQCCSLPEMFQRIYTKDEA